MFDTPSPAVAAARGRAGTLRESLYRYFFYGWLFRDADAGPGLERASALRHNRDQARWLPVYLRRWAIGGAVVWACENASERVFGNALLSAVFAVALVWVVLFLLVTAVCWAFLHVSRPSR
jgi:fatty acid desaturase